MWPRALLHVPWMAPEGAATYNMNGQVLDVEEMIGIIGELVPSARGRITCRRDQTIAMASIVEDSGLQALIGPFEPTPFREGMGETADFFRRVHRLSDWEHRNRCSHLSPSLGGGRAMPEQEACVGSHTADRMRLSATSRAN